MVVNPGKHTQTKSLSKSPAMPSTRASEGGTVRRVTHHCHVQMEADTPGPSPLGPHFTSLSPSFPRGGRTIASPRVWALSKRSAVHPTTAVHVRCILLPRHPLAPESQAQILQVPSAEGLLLGVLTPVRSMSSAWLGVSYGLTGMP